MSCNGLSLIIPTFNRAAHIRRTLESIRKVKVPKGCGLELLVIDNNCTDETSAIATEISKTYPFPLKVISEKRQGLCFGRNRGIEESSYDLLGFLDDDIELSENWTVAALSAFQELAADVVIGPVTPVFSGSRPNFLTGYAYDIISSSYSLKGDKVILVNAAHSHEIPGCNFAVRKEMAIRLDGFNTTLDRIGSRLLAGGDFDFGLRVKSLGGRVFYSPELAIKHLIISEKLTKTYLRRRAYGIGVTNRRLYLPHRSIRGSARVLFSIVILLLRRFSSVETRFSIDLKILTGLGLLIGR